MSNPIQQRPLEPILREMELAGLSPTGPFAIAIRDMLTRSDKTQTNLGQIQSVAPVTGRDEGIGTTVQNVDSAGVVTADGVDFTRPYLNKNVANIPETSNLRYRTMAHSSAQIIGLTITGHDTGGGQAEITGSASTLRVPGDPDVPIAGFIAIGLSNSQKYQIYLDTPNFDGSGSVTVTTDANALFSSPARTYLGNNSTPAGGGGDTTGTPGGLSGPRLNLLT